MREGWKNITLGAFCTLHYGKGIAQKDYSVNGGTAIYGTSGLIGYTNLLPQSTGPAIIIGRKGSINSPKFVNFGTRFRVIDTAYYLETEEDINFVYYLLGSLNFLKWNEASGVPSLNRETFYNINVQLPSLPEQQKIAAILRTWDDAIEKTERLISARQKQKNLIRNKILKPLTGWQKKALGDVCVLHYGKGISRDQYIEDGDTYVYGTSGQIGKTKLDPQFLGPSVVIGRKGTINYPILIESGQKFRVIDTAYFLETKENVTFLFYLIDALNLLKLNEASGVPSLSRDTLYNIKISLPSITEQKKIAEVLVAADETIDSLKKKKILFQTQKRGLMQKLLTGEWRTNFD